MVVEDIVENVIERMILQEWVSIFEYSKGVEQTKVPVEANNLEMIMKSYYYSTTKIG